MKNNSLIYGLRAVIEAIQSKKSIHKIFVQKGLQGDLFHELKSISQNAGIGISYVPKEKLNRMAKGNHQGVVAEISPVAFKTIDEFFVEIESVKKPLLLLLLDGVSDVRNFGAIIRTAECTGVHGIIISKDGSAPVNESTIKTSAGAAFRVPIIKVDHLKDAVFYLQSSGIKTIAATEKAEKNIYSISFDKPCAIVMGAEDKGVSPSLLKIVDEQAKLPMMGKIGSLNVSVACGAFLYEAVRQRQPLS